MLNSTSRFTTQPHVTFVHPKLLCQLSVVLDSALPRTEFPATRHHVCAALIEPIDHDHAISSCRCIATANQHTRCYDLQSFTKLLIYGLHVSLWVTIAQDHCEQVTAIVFACNGVQLGMSKCQSFLRPQVSGLNVFHLSSKPSS